MLWLFVLGAGIAVGAEPIRTPYARREPLQIRRVVPPASPVRQYGVVELVVELAATYDNPFDASDIALDARVTLPGGKVRSVPGFLYRPFDRKEEQSREVLLPSGEPSWRVRFAAPVAGEYTVVVVARDRTGERQSEPVRFAVEASDDPGFVRVSPRDHRYFEFDNGRAYFPIGLNLCWPGGARGTYDYDAWIPEFAKVGCNATRLWLSPDWIVLALERSGRPEDGFGMGQFDLAAAWRLDYVLRLATQHGMYVKLCIDSYNILRPRNAYPHWERTPHNAANGGPLAVPTDFWTNPAMERFYRDKLRYLVARYGCFTHVLSWEFWNEVDITSDFKAEPVREWHQRMARHVRSIDPDAHLITTSFANSNGVPTIDQLAELDYVQTHRYGGFDPAADLASYQARKAEYGKPHYVGEVGADSGGDRFADDPDGMQVHDPLWLTVANGGSGTAQPWFWEKIHSRHLHPLFGAVVRFTSGIDWPAEQMRSVEPRFTWEQPTEPLPRKDLVLDTVGESWSPSEYNRPRTVQLDRSGVHGQIPLASIQHGMGGHKDKHNPVRLETDLPWPIRFGVNVHGVSGWGGAALEIRLDDRVVLKKDFSDTNPPGEHKTLLQYCGSYEVDVPAGRHVLELENGGPDWFTCSYRLRDAVECHTPPLLGWATVGRSNVLAWVRLEARAWTRVCVLKESLPPCAPSMLVLPEVAAGRWKAEIWDTHTGQVAGERMIDVAADGEARFPLPEIATDVAVRLKRQ